MPDSTDDILTSPDHSASPELSDRRGILSRRTSRRVGSAVSTRVAAQEGFVQKGFVRKGFVRLGAQILFVDARRRSEGFVIEGFVQKVLFRRFCSEGFVQKVLLKESFVRKGFVQKGFVYNDAVIGKNVTMYCVQLHERSTSTHVL
jgi:hypothetical protein